MIENLWKSSRTGAASTSKAWRNIAYLVATVSVLTNPTSWELLLVYLGAVGGSEVALRFLDAKYPK